MASSSADGINRFVYVLAWIGGVILFFAGVAGWEQGRGFLLGLAIAAVVQATLVFLVVNALTAKFTMDAKPESAVSVLADADTAVTAFIPTDGAFRKLVWQMGEHDWQTISEQEVFNAVAGLGIDAVETVLLHHVVVGPAIDLKTAVGADGAALDSAAGQDLNVEVGTSVRIDGSYGGYWSAQVSLARTDINEGNDQLAHVINNVLVPDLG